MSKRLAVLHKEVRTSNLPETRRWSVGLSLGPSSSVLVHLLHEYVVRGERNKSHLPSDVLAIHVDTDLSHPPPRAAGGEGQDQQEESEAQRRIALYRDRYPRIQFETVHVSEILDVKTIDWSTLPLPPTEDGVTPSQRLQAMFDSLPSTTSRADILRHLTRHLLLHRAMIKERKYVALLLGHSVTTLAALTLSEVANGRGFSIPWQVNDGPIPLSTYDFSPSPPSNTPVVVSKTEFPIHHPLREISTGEIKGFINFTDPLRELVSLGGGDGKGRGSVVSHKDLSIDEVMTRYFENVEESYASIVANVVRTTGKLDRVSASDSMCGLCGVALDEKGDSRWAGEIGDDEDGQKTRLCYGCKRSVRG